MIGSFLSSYWLSTKSIYIICLHRITDEYSPAYPPMRLSVFEALLRFLLEFFEPIHFGQTSESHKPKVILTFDDGYLDFFEYAFPLLEKYNFPFVLNLVTDCLNTGESIWSQQLNKLVEVTSTNGLCLRFKDGGLYFSKQKNKVNQEKTALRLYTRLTKLSKVHRFEVLQEAIKQFPNYNPTAMMSWDDARIVAASPLSQIGCHTASHDNLANDLTYQDYETEITNPKLLLEQRLNCQVKIFAFPNGENSKKAIEVAKRTGFQFLLGTDAKVIQEAKWPTVIPRILLYHNKHIFNILNMLKAKIHSLSVHS